MKYPQALAYLESFVNYEKFPHWSYKGSLKLNRIKTFLQVLGNPQDSLACIHVAGSKGKGSTAVFIAYILRSAGYTVGLYTSPHLSDFRERIRILRPIPLKEKTCFEGMISKRDLARLVQYLKPKTKAFNARTPYGELSFFEIYTALAFMYFREKRVDFVVLETGLGGRLDATNTVIPLGCVITPISYEHTQILGNTLGEIAREKTGIIKNAKAFVISSPQAKEAAAVIRQKCKKMRAVLYEVGRDIKFRPGKNSFDVKGIFHTYPHLKIKLKGSHQTLNAAAAVSAVEALRFYNIDISAGAIRKGLAKALWPGRCEIIAHNPLIVLDGAQNSASAKVLKETIKSEFRYRKLILVLGISDDKDKRGICRHLKGLADAVILTKADNPRAAKPEKLAKYIGKNCLITKTVKEAKAAALKMAGKSDLILVTGSLFVVGEARELDKD